MPSTVTYTLTCLTPRKEVIHEPLLESSALGHRKKLHKGSQNLLFANGSKGVALNGDVQCLHRNLSSATHVTARAWV